jgi:hypothetical protein
MGGMRASLSVQIDAGPDSDQEELDCSNESFAVRVNLATKT